MAPRLRVLAGTSPSTMVPITHLVNTPQAHPVRSPLFEGEIVAHIKGLTDERGRVRESAYFEREDRGGVTWSIVVRGRFLVPYSADDILFGNTFDRPLKLPWGTSAVLKFMHYIDPTLEHDLTSSSKPWALSPLIATMPHFMHTRSSSSSPSEPPFNTTESIKDNNSELYLALADEMDEVDSSSTSSGASSRSASSSSDVALPLVCPASLDAVKVSKASSSSSGSSSSGGSSFSVKSAVRKVKRRRSDREGGRAKRERELQGLESASQRRSYFAQRARRRDVVFGPEDVITTDFCYGFINFAPSLSLQLPGGLSFDLMKYWDGQPVRFVCCERVPTRKGGAGTGEQSQEPWGRIFWCVAIEVVDDEN
ncbi:hypothetical protein CVT25_010592 [Psilocybe cyanescens]|uniref:Domain of unknown function at the cortex 1 domain-containing protein n=1 Tax=Psilocybe cyanescens TaxID=93625 RepID=A0A409WJC7_PSICY|nr:hypothetical protein CVT25_010592 [Psilocybe cyanescens]